MTASTYDPCVCVRPDQEKSGAGKERRAKPQEGGVCVDSHTAEISDLLCCCCFVAMQIASRSVVLTYTSTSRLLVDFWGRFR